MRGYVHRPALQPVSVELITPSMIMTLVVVVTLHLAILVTCAAMLMAARVS